MYEKPNAKVYLVKDNKSDYVILLGENHSPIDAIASNRFNDILKLSTGVTLPVVTEGTGEYKKFISIGKTRALIELNLASKHGKGGYSVKFEKGNLYLFGEDYSASLWAVEGLLERILGYKYYADDEIKIDKVNDVEISECDFYETPTIQNRSSGFWYGTTYNPNGIKYAMGLKAHTGFGIRADGTPFWGCWDDIIMSCHNHLNILPLDKYYEKHPEWYNDKKNQLCLSNMQMRDEFFKNFIEYLKYYKTQTHFILGHQDNADMCYCENCRKRIDQVGTGGLHVEFINDIARRTEKWRLENCPEREISVGMFAYETVTSMVPPVKRVNGEIVPKSDSVVAEPNVFILFAPIGAKDHSKPITAPENAFFYDCFKYWHKVCKRFCIWMYYGSFRRCLEFTDGIYVFKENIKALKELGCEYFFVEENNSMGALVFHKLHLYVLTQLEWNVNQDTDELINEFMDAYYKCASKYMREFFDYLMNYFRKMREVTTALSGRKFSCGICYDDLPPEHFWSMESVYDMIKILDKAFNAIEESALSNEEKQKLKDRVELERLFTINIQLEYFVRLTNDYDEARVVNAYTKERALALVDEFVEGAKKFGIVRVDGDGELPDTVAKWKREILETARAWEDRKAYRHRVIDELHKKYQK